VIFDFGGYVSGTTAVGTMDSWDPIGGWTSQPAMPTARANLAGVTVGTGTVYAVGGVSGTIFYSTVEAFDAPLGVWSTRADMATPRAAFAVALFTPNPNVFAVFGGLNATGTLKACELYDAASDAWIPQANMPTARSGAAAVMAAGLMYVAGGADSAGNALTTLEAFNAGGNSWSSKASMGVARQGLTLVALGGTLYAIGGTGSAGGALNVVEAYDTATDTWTSQTGMPTARSGLGAVTFSGTIYAVGGRTDSATVATMESAVWACAAATTPPATSGPPAPSGRTEVRNNVIRTALGQTARINVHGGAANAAVTFVVYNQAGIPLGTIGAGAVTDGQGDAVVAFDGKARGAVLKSGVYWIVVSGAVTARLPVMIVTPESALR